MNQSLNAPPVKYPVGRSRFLAAILLGLWAGGMAASLLAARLGALSAWRLAALATGGLFASGLAAHFWWRMPRGRLHWDGGNWSFERAGLPAIAGEVRVVLDLQARLLLVFETRAEPAGGEAVSGGARRCWLWADSAAERGGWHGLRCAVYCSSSRAKSDARSDTGAADP